MFCHSHPFPLSSIPIFHSHSRQNPNCSFPPSILHSPYPPSKTLILSSSSPPPPNESEQETLTLTPNNPSRLQNTFLHHRHQHRQGIDDEEELQRRKIIDEASLAVRRIPRFPGSVDFPKPDQPPPLIDLRALGADEGALRRALEVRRGVAGEVLKSALRAKKLSITYSTNLVSRLEGFVDRVVVEAAAMRGVPEFAHLTFNARAKSYIESSGVVELVKWLKHNSLTYPQIGKLICATSGYLEQVRHIAEWLKTIHVKGISLGVVLVKASCIVERSIEFMEEIVDCLERNGVRREWVGFVVTRCPQVLALTIEELETRVNFYLDMGMDEKDFGTMVFDYPRVLGFFSLDEMNSKVQYLKEFGLSTEDVGRLLAFKPQLMGCSIEGRWRPLVKYLYYLGVRRDGMKRILLAKPMIFCVDLETTIAPKVRFLQDIGIREEDIGGVLAKFPAFLTYSLYKKIRPVVIFLMTKAGVTKSDIAKVIAFDPQLTGCSITKKLEVNVKYFLSLGIRLHSLGEMIADFPMLLRYNLDVVQPKYRYLRRTMVRPLQELIEFPRFLSYSMEGRIVPRHEILVANRLNFKLRYMLPGSDEVFNQRVQAALENRRRFESGETTYDISDSDPSHVSSVHL
ncbi:transcription termination factor MTERF2, chloroplastic isoform X1 [Iris pallida]|uniref:Transcription termination factor MTERF2, chloroplastic isoform X1 n=1 Tax=Iris pallida TaxID=29817 RepID=A0AAX6FNI1_IRIPA|nr:transcription termination factor MTERF2, chloroplastic isoform X1 [Iris pallida]